MKNKVTIIYASQTGQAQAIAESINDMLLENDFGVSLFCASAHGDKFKLNELSEPVVFISSTTGDGEPPEKGLKLFNWLKRLKAGPDHLPHFNYALLGLGDSNYAQFCNGPKSFHKKFQELGATCFYGPSWADDGTGLEVEVEPFKDGLVDALLDYFAKQSAQVQDATAPVVAAFDQMRINVFKNDELKDTELTVPLMPEKHINLRFEDSVCSGPLDTLELLRSLNTANILCAKVVDNQVITSPEAVKSCFDIKFECNSFSYQPGHSIDVFCPNNADEVDALLKRLRVAQENLTKTIKISSDDPAKKTGSGFVKMSQAHEMDIRTFFTYCVDVRNDSLKKATLRMLAEHCEDEKDKRRLLELCSREGSAHYQTLVKEGQISLLDLLNIFESCHPPLDILVQLVSPLASRPYSLCTSPQANGSTLEFVFNLIEFEADTARTYKRTGVATGHLSRLKPNETFYFSARNLQAFTLPEDCAAKNVLMFGPGTGIAPFIGFLRHRKSLASTAQDSAGFWWLFYGCRDPNKDFLFKSELVTDLHTCLSKFSVSFSRFTYDTTNNQEEKSQDPARRFHEADCKYVMDVIRLYKKKLSDLILEPNTFIYVCGDANNMSKDIMNALQECLSDEAEGFTAESAKAYLFDMMKNKRYRQEIWA